MSNYLYHFFPRKFEDANSTLAMVRSMFENGFFLSREMLKVDWKDVYAIGSSERKLDAEQYRFCLTAITTEEELKTHSNLFGLIGFQFTEEFIVKAGGFPVFYVPTPTNENAENEEYFGVSLLYRIADAQQILEHVWKDKLIKTDDIDLENVLGAVKFLANICYPTQRLRRTQPGEINYYNQREWRIIHNLTPEKVKIGYVNNCHTIEAYDQVPIRNFITKITIHKAAHLSEKIQQDIFMGVERLADQFGVKCRPVFI